MTNRLEILKTDITTLAVDAIVNAANSSLLGGGGVDGAIHDAAGPELIKECMTLGGCETGRAKITRGYRLPARYVIHAVGPIWYGGNRNERELLVSCYKSCFQVAKEYDLRTLAFPAISCGAYRFPINQAAEIAVRETQAELAHNSRLEKVILTCFDNAVYSACTQALADHQ